MSTADAHQPPNGSIERWIIRGLMGLLCFVCMFVWNQVQTHDREIMELRVLRERDAGERAVLRTTISRLDVEVDRLRGQAVKPPGGQP